MLERQQPEGSALPETIADGVYFNLDADDYHRDPALGSGDVGLLLKHPGDYWWASWMNPKRRRVETDYQAWGRAFHVLIVEGEETFDARYFRGPSKHDFPGVMVTMPDLRKWLQLHAFAVSGNKDTLEKRVLAADPTAPVWSEIERRAEVQASGRIVLDPQTYDEIVVSSAFITKNPSCAKAFTNGYPEVSVFYTVGEMYVDGHGNWPVRCKARFDYVKYRAVVDLKSIRPWNKMKEFDVAINDAISGYGYDVQAAHYCNARDRMADLIREGKVYGQVEQAWLHRFLELSREEYDFIWIFYQADGAPISRGVEFRKSDDYAIAAANDVSRALERYRRYMSVFGTLQWVDVQPRRRLTGEDLRTRLATIV